MVKDFEINTELSVYGLGTETLYENGVNGHIGTIDKRMLRSMYMRISLLTIVPSLWSPIFI